jgi:hypothetical protein
LAEQRDLALEQGWSAERYDRDLAWRRCGFPEEQVDRRLVAFLGASYKLFFDEDPPWYIFEPGELEIMLSLTPAEQMKAHASALAAIVNVEEERGRIRPDRARWARRYARTVSARATIHDRRGSIRGIHRPRQAPRSSRRRSARSRALRARAPTSSESSDDSELAAALARGRP